MSDSVVNNKEYGAIQCTDGNNCKATVDDHGMDNKKHRDDTNDYRYPKYMDEEEIKYNDIKKLKEKEKHYGNLLTNMNGLQADLNSLNSQIVQEKSSQTRNTLELKRDQVREKIMEKQKRLDKVLQEMSDVTQSTNFKGDYNSFLDASNRTVDQIFKKSDELQANITSFNTNAMDYQRHIKDYDDSRVNIQKNTLFYQTWIFVAIISIIVIVMNKKVPTRIIAILIAVYVLYVLYNFYYLITMWIRSFF